MHLISRNIVILIFSIWRHHMGRLSLISYWRRTFYLQSKQMKHWNCTYLSIYTKKQTKYCKWSLTFAVFVSACAKAPFMKDIKIQIRIDRRLLFKTRESIYLHHFNQLKTKDLFYLFFNFPKYFVKVILVEYWYFKSIECIHQHQPSWTVPFLTVYKVFYWPHGSLYILAW